MAEKVSGLIALCSIALLLCSFIPAASYTMYRILSRKFRDGYSRWDFVAFLVMITAFGTMLHIMINAQQLYPRCGIYGGDSHMLLCLIDRYNDTGPVIERSRGQAAALMRFDLLSDVATCVIAPSTLGVAVVLGVCRAIKRYQTRHIPKIPNS